MVTIQSLTKIGLYSWLLKYSSNLESPWFYIYLGGCLIAETPQNQYNIAINMDESSVIEVLDDPDAQPMQIFPGKVRLGWFWAAGTNYYRIDEYIDSNWIERYRMPENNGYLSWQSRFLEDGQTHIFRVVPVGTNGNEGTARQFAVLMCRRPDVPDVGFGYNEGAGDILIFDNESPEQIIYNCKDNAPDTIVINSMGLPNGVLMGGKTTAQMHVAGGFDFDGLNDYIDAGDCNLIFQNSFSIRVRCKPDFNSDSGTSCLFGTDKHPATRLMFSIDDNTKKIKGQFQAGGPDGFVVDTDQFWESPPDDYTTLTLVIKKNSENSVTLYIYADGVLLASGSSEQTMSQFDGQNLLIGALNDPEEVTHYFSGCLGCIRIFNQALS